MVHISPAVGHYGCPTLPRHMLRWLRAHRLLLSKWPTTTRSRQTTGDTTGALNELFHAALAIKVARAEERMVGYFAEVSEQRQLALLIHAGLWNEQ